MQSIALRLAECGLTMHPEKSKIVYCKDSNRTESSQHVYFTLRELRPDQSLPASQTPGRTGGVVRPVAAETGLLEGFKSNSGSTQTQPNHPIFNAGRHHRESDPAQTLPSSSWLRRSWPVSLSIDIRGQYLRNTTDIQQTNLTC
jgi:hypothetical protein